MKEFSSRPLNNALSYPFPISGKGRYRLGRSSLFTNLKSHFSGLQLIGPPTSSRLKPQVQTGGLGSQ
jgi:hypothetical protein